MVSNPYALLYMEKIRKYDKWTKEESSAFFVFGMHISVLNSSYTITSSIGDVNVPRHVLVLKPPTHSCMFIVSIS